MNMTMYIITRHNVVVSKRPFVESLLKLDTVTEIRYCHDAPARLKRGRSE